MLLIPFRPIQKPGMEINAAEMQDSLENSFTYISPIGELRGSLPSKPNNALSKTPGGRLPSPSPNRSTPCIIDGLPLVDGLAGGVTMYGEGYSLLC